MGCSSSNTSTLLVAATYVNQSVIQHFVIDKKLTPFIQKAFQKKQVEKGEQFAQQPRQKGVQGEVEKKENFENQSMNGIDDNIGAKSYATCVDKKQFQGTYQKEVDPKSSEQKQHAEQIDIQDILFDSASKRKVSSAVIEPERVEINEPKHPESSIT